MRRAVSLCRLCYSLFLNLLSHCCLKKKTKSFFGPGSSHRAEDGLIKHISSCTNSSWFISVFKIKHFSKCFIFLIPRFVFNECSSSQTLPIAPGVSTDRKAVTCSAALRPSVGAWESREDLLPLSTLAHPCGGGDEGICYFSKWEAN